VADLLSHGLIAWIVGARGLDRNERGWFVTGTVAPDLASRVPRTAVEVAVDKGWVDGGAGLVPLLLGLDMPHTPVGVVLLAVLLAAAVPPGWAAPHSRARLGLLMGGGALLHLLVDVFQEHIVPAYHLLYPATVARWEIGWISTEASLALLPVLAVVAWLITPKGDRSGERPPFDGAGSGSD